MDRIMALSDGIFGVAITLLVLTIDVPDLAKGSTDAELWSRLVAQAPEFLSFILGFIVVGAFWISHHQKLRFIKRYDKTFLWINIFSLLLVCLLPFTTNLLGDYENSQLALILFASNLFLVSLMFTLMWVYATYKRRLVDVDLDKSTIQEVTMVNLLIAGLFVGSIILSFLHIDAAKYSWLLIIPLVFMFKK